MGSTDQSNRNAATQRIRNTTAAHKGPETAAEWAHQVRELEGRLAAQSDAGLHVSGSAEQRADARARLTDLRSTLADAREKHAAAVARETAASPATHTQADIKALEREAGQLAAQLRAIEAEKPVAPKLAKLAAPALEAMRYELKSKRAAVEQARKNAV